MNGMIVEVPEWSAEGDRTPATDSTSATVTMVPGKAVVVEFFPEGALCIATSDMFSAHMGPWKMGEFSLLAYNRIRSIPTPTAPPAADGSHTCVRGHGGKCQICGNRMVHNA